MSKINNTKLIGGMEKQQKTMSLDLDNSKKTINSSSISRSISQIIKSETTQDGEGVTLKV
jgi:hypothetical protein